MTETETICGVPFIRVSELTPEQIAVERLYGAMTHAENIKSALKKLIEG